MDYKKYVVDFVEGRSNPKDFIEYCEKNPQVLDWLQSIVPQERKSYKMTRYDVKASWPCTVHEISKDITVWKDSDNNIVAQEEAIPFDIRMQWGIWFQHGKNSAPRNLLNLHQGISDIIAEAFLNKPINVSKYYKKRHDFILDALPSYIRGQEAEELVDKIVQSLPKDMPNKKRITEVKEKVKEAFHLGGGEYPIWVQDGDWPFSKTRKPMKFISQKEDENSEVIELTFEDVDTGERVVVEDWIS